jgi:hypothetical protein
MKRTENSNRQNTSIIGVKYQTKEQKTVTGRIPQ